MDPNACVQRIIDALNDGDIEEARDAQADLQAWLGNGGFPPDDKHKRLYLEALQREEWDEDCEEDYYDDAMDGDFDSAMASAGYGTDEDYGCFGGEEW